MDNVSPLLNLSVKIFPSKIGIFLYIILFNLSYQLTQKLSFVASLKSPGYQLIYCSPIDDHCNDHLWSFQYDHFNIDN